MFAACFAMLCTVAVGHPVLAELRRRKFGKGHRRRRAGRVRHARPARPTMGGIIFLIAIVIAALRLRRTARPRDAGAAAGDAGRRSARHLRRLSDPRRPREDGGARALVLGREVGRLASASLSPSPPTSTPISTSTHVVVPHFGAYSLGVLYLPVAVSRLRRRHHRRRDHRRHGRPHGRRQRSSPSRPTARSPWRRARRASGAFAFSVAGATAGFLWFNAYPAQRLHGRHRRAGPGVGLVVVAFMTGWWLLLPVIGVVFVAEGASDVIQIGYFKLTHGKRVFRMAPIHYHFQLGGWPETRVVARFWLLACSAPSPAWTGGDGMMRTVALDSAISQRTRSEWLGLGPSMTSTASASPSSASASRAKTSRATSPPRRPRHRLRLHDRRRARRPTPSRPSQALGVDPHLGAQRPRGRRERRPRRGLSGRAADEPDRRRRPRARHPGRLHGQPLPRPLARPDLRHHRQQRQDDHDLARRCHLHAPRDASHVARRQHRPRPAGPARRRASPTAGPCSRSATPSCTSRSRSPHVARPAARHAQPPRPVHLGRIRRAQAPHLRLPDAGRHRSVQRRRPGQPGTRASQAQGRRFLFGIEHDHGQRRRLTSQDEAIYWRRRRPRRATCWRSSDIHAARLPQRCQRRRAPPPSPPPAASARTPSRRPCAASRRRPTALEFVAQRRRRRLLQRQHRHLAGAHAWRRCAASTSRSSCCSAAARSTCPWKRWSHEIVGALPRRRLLRRRPARSWPRR